MAKRGNYTRVSNGLLFRGAAVDPTFGHVNAYAQRPYAQTPDRQFTRIA
jgi:hypothetical protein